MDDPTVDTSVVIADITPEHSPLSLARDMVEMAPECSSGIYVLVHEDGSLTSDMAGRHRMEILWALQKMMHQIMDE